MQLLGRKSLGLLDNELQMWTGILLCLWRNYLPSWNVQ